MRELLLRLIRRPGLTFELALASFFINFLAFADTIFVMIVLRRYITYGFDGTLLLLSLGTIIAVLMQYGLREARTGLAHGISEKPDRELSRRFFDVLVKARSSQLPDAEGGKDYLPALSDMRQAYDAPKITAFLDAPFSLLFVAAVLVLSVELAAVVAAGMLVSLVLGLLTVRRNYRFMHSVNDLAAKTRGMLAAAWTGADAVRLFGGRDLYRRFWKKGMRDVDAGRRSADDGREFGQGLTGGASVLVRVGVYAVGAKLVVEGKLTFAALIGASILGSYAVQKITVFVQTWPSLTRASRAKDVLDEFFALPKEPEDGKSPEEYFGRLEFMDTAYAYPGAKTPLFTGLSLTLKSGEVLAVNGYNGSGKTTLMRLVAGLLEPTYGAVLADGVSLVDLDPAWWRSQIVYMPQEPVFMTATIRENVLSGNPDLDDTELNRITRASGLKQFIDSSPKGMETMLSGGGSNLPVGTRKRLALARALATNGRLILLDEPTEGLDAEGRNAVYATMNTLAKEGRTIVVVTYDRNILKGASRILDLSQKPEPQVVEKGVAGSEGEEES